MALQRDRFLVYVTDDPAALPRELAVIVTHQDMLRGEQAMLGQPGISLDHGLLLTTAWAWASLMRQGDYANSWQTFRDQDCAGIEKMDPVEVDPTQPGTTGDSV